MSFTHLHVHSIHSLYYSALKVEDAVEETIRRGMNALAITDYDSLYAAHDFVQYAHSISPDFKPIVGCELHVSASKDIYNNKLQNKAPHLTILCKNEIGYRNLCKLLAIAWNEGFFSALPYLLNSLLSIKMD